MKKATVLTILAVLSAACSDDTSPMTGNDAGVDILVVPDGGVDAGDASVPDSAIIDGGETFDAGTDGGVMLPAVCRPTCEASRFGDDSTLAAGPVGATASERLGTLIVTPPGAFSYSDTWKFRIHAEGFGLTPDYMTSSEFARADLSNYSSVIFFNSAWVGLSFNAFARVKIEELAERGADLLWIGSNFPESLATTFGITSVGPSQAAPMLGISELTFEDSTGVDVSTPIFEDEYVSQVVPAPGTETMARFGDTGTPAATQFTRPDNFGRATLVPFGVTHYWGESLENDVWLRAEMMSEILFQFASNGSVLVDSYPDGHTGAYLVRFEDISPGGTRSSQNDEPWITRFADVIAYLDSLGVHANLGLIARYVDPIMDENYGWLTPDPGRAELLATLREALETYGAEPISHGWTHQYGVRDQDVTGVDWEFSDDTSGEWVFLPYEEQVARMINAQTEIAEAFDVMPRVWETPHLEGNADTYRAATELGWTIINESDGNLFPNRWGPELVIADQALNIPHTGSYVPHEDIEGYLAVSVDHAMPRLTRMRAPFFWFYHNFEGMEVVAQTLSECAVGCGLWSTTLSEFADWYTDVRDTTVSSTQTASALTARVGSHPAGTTLRVRLPDGVSAMNATVNGTVTPLRASIRRGVGWAQIVLPGGASAEVVVRYAP